MSGPDRDDDELDDASLKSMRAVWLSMRDEEPPAAGMSALLAAAREKAEQMRETPSWWQRVTALLRRPPVLAFASVMILIGGAVLVTRGTQDQQVDALSSAGPEAPASAESASDLRVREAEPVKDRAVDEKPAATAEPAVVPSDPTPAPTNSLEANKESPAKEVVRPRPPKQRKAQVASDDQPGKYEPDRHNRFESDAPTGGFTAGKGDAVDTTLGTPGRTAPSKPGTTTAQPPPPDRTPARPAEPTEPAGEAVILSDSGKVTTPPNEQLARQAESAASRGDCAAVRVIVARLKKQDEAFFKARLGKNAAVAKCL